MNKSVLARNRVFLIALGISTSFHLSMVTLFNIGIWFDVNPVEYYHFDIVPIPAASSRSFQSSEPLSSGPRLTMPSYDDATQTNEYDIASEWDMPRLADEHMIIAGLPQVELPTLFLEDLERLHLQRRSLEIRSRRAGMSRDSPGDTWSRFGQEIAQLRDVLRTGLGLGDRSEHLSTGVSRSLISVPAEGFESHIEWMSPPHDRQLLFSPPIPALMHTDSRDFIQPVTFIITVRPDGGIREVLQGVIIDDSTLAVDLMRAINRYRFTPLPAGETYDQRATVLIVSAIDMP